MISNNREKKKSSTHHKIPTQPYMASLSYSNFALQQLQEDCQSKIKAKQQLSTF